MTPVVLLTFHKAQQGVDAAFGTYVYFGIFFLVSFFFLSELSIRYPTCSVVLLRCSSWSMGTKKAGELLCVNIVWMHKQITIHW